MPAITLKHYKRVEPIDPEDPWRAPEDDAEMEGTIIVRDANEAKHRNAYLKALGITDEETCEAYEASSRATTPAPQPKWKRKAASTSRKNNGRLPLLKRHKRAPSFKVVISTTAKKAKKDLWVDFNSEDEERKRVGLTTYGNKKNLIGKQQVTSSQLEDLKTEFTESESEGDTVDERDGEYTPMPEKRTYKASKKSAQKIVNGKKVPTSTTKSIRQPTLKRKRSMSTVEDSIAGSPAAKAARKLLGKATTKKGPAPGAAPHSNKSQKVTYSSSSHLSSPSPSPTPKAIRRRSPSPILGGTTRHISSRTTTSSIASHIPRGRKSMLGGHPRNIISRSQPKPRGRGRTPKLVTAAARIQRPTFSISAMRDNGGERNAMNVEQAGQKKWESINLDEEAMAEFEKDADEFKELLSSSSQSTPGKGKAENEGSNSPTGTAKVNAQQEAQEEAEQRKTQKQQVPQTSSFFRRIFNLKGFHT